MPTAKSICSHTLTPGAELCQDERVRRLHKEVPCALGALIWRNCSASPVIVGRDAAQLVQWDLAFIRPWVQSPVPRTLGTLVHVCSLSTRGVEAEGSEIRGQPCYIVIPGHPELPEVLSLKGKRRGTVTDVIQPWAKPRVRTWERL